MMIVMMMNTILQKPLLASTLNKSQTACSCSTKPSPSTARFTVPAGSQVYCASWLYFAGQQVHTEVGLRYWILLPLSVSKELPV